VTGYDDDVMMMMMMMMCVYSEKSGEVDSASGKDIVTYLFFIIELFRHGIVFLIL